MTYLVVNPFWNIPTSIAVKDILPKVKKETSYLSQQGIKIFENWRKGALELNPETIDWSLIEPENFSFKLRQDPGPRNALGRIKFMFPNKFAVYLHDTPKRSLFKETVRDFSSGCIRIERPMDLAVYLLKDDPQWTKEKLLKIIAAGEPQTIKLKRPIAVHLQYWTAWVDENNVLHFRDDIYDRDEPLDRALKERLPGI
jgi:murein L,D-transpeptidase YcbB/YkuD